MDSQTHYNEKSRHKSILAEAGNTTPIAGIDQSLLPVFQQNWWLETARGHRRCEEARVLKDGVVVGRLPYILRRGRSGLRWGAAPDWSHLSGPVISQHLDHKEKSDVIYQLIAQLPRNIPIGFTCGPDAADKDLIRQACKAAGFEHSLEVTYSQSSKEPDVMSRVIRKHRLRLESAARRLDILEINEDEFIKFYATNLKEANLKSHDSLDIARNLIAKGREGDTPQVRVTAAKRKGTGPPLDAAIACAWDKTRYYFWMSTRRHHAAESAYEKPHPDAIKILLINAMAHARHLGLIFDVDGVSTPGIKTLYNEILRVPNEEFRDTFVRATKFVQWYRVYFGKLQQMAISSYSGG